MASLERAAVTAAGLTCFQVPGVPATVLRASGGAILGRHGYQYDPAHQRTQQTLAEGNTWDYDYDALGQLISARGREAGGASRLQEQLSYGYDAAGNLTARTNQALIQTFT